MVYLYCLYYIDKTVTYVKNDVQNSNFCDFVIEHI